jgi:aminoglycoside phosphotransferase (APT) family kinase protein
MDYVTRIGNTGIVQSLLQTLTGEGKKKSVPRLQNLWERWARVTQSVSHSHPWYIVHAIYGYAAL